MGHLPGIFFGVVFILAGSFLVRRALKTMQEIKAATDWPRVSCTIITCEIGEEYAGGTDGTSGMMHYFAEIEYKYVVDNANYSNDEISMGGIGNTSNREAMTELCGKYPINSTQELFYNPDDPEESYLELTTKVSKVEVIGGIIFFLAGIAILWWFGSILLGSGTASP